MSNTSTTTTGGGIGFAGLLFIVFLVLKLTHVIDWPWILIFAPIWGSVVLLIIVVLIFAAIIRRN